MTDAALDDEGTLYVDRVELLVPTLGAGEDLIFRFSVVVDPGTADARVDLLFYERAFTFWGEGHRQSDLRRLVRQYGRSANSVFPTGDYFKGGIFGNDVDWVIPQEEENNPNFTQCLNRGA